MATAKAALESPVTVFKGDTSHAIPDLRPTIKVELRPEIIPPQQWTPEVRRAYHIEDMRQKAERLKFALRKLSEAIDHAASHDGVKREIIDYAIRHTGTRVWRLELKVRNWQQQHEVVGFLSIFPEIRRGRAALGQVEMIVQQTQGPNGSVTNFALKSFPGVFKELADSIHRAEEEFLTATRA